MSFNDPFGKGVGLLITFNDLNDFGRDCGFEGRGKECDDVDPEGGADSNAE